MNISDLLQLLESHSSPLIFWFIISGLVVILVNDFALLPLALMHEKLQKKYRTGKYAPLVSIIIPVHNEERVVGNLIETLLEQSYKRTEIIVVNDASTDNTEQVLLYYSRKKQIRLLNIPPPNLGKFEALNAGIRISQGEIIVVLDADGLLERNAVANLIAPFENPHVVAVSGNIKVGNRVNLLTRCQALEYIRDINLPRRALDLLDISIVIPGPLAAFRKSYIQTIGLYDSDTVAEDFDLTIKIHKARDHRAFYARNLTDAVVYTEAPEKLKDLFRQRRRWYGGMAQSVAKHIHERFLRGAGSYSMIGAPYILITLFLIPILELIVSGFSIWVALTGGFLWILYSYLIYTLFETLTSLLALIIDKEDLRLVAYSPLFVFGYRQILDLFKLYSFLKALSGKMTWTRASRYGGMTLKLR